MCGLVGLMTTTLKANERKAMEDLLFMDTLRGEHSTGIATHTKDDGTWYYKRAVSGPDFLNLPTAKKMLNEQWVLCMGHNRAATKGKVNDQNAHPFHHDNILGMHNGTLTSTTNLENHTKFEVDSDNIFYDMSKNGAEVTIPKLRGAFCLTWIDTKKGTFNICRNAQRPMYLGWNRASNLFMYSSEEHILRAVVSGDRQGRAAIPLENIKPLDVGEWIAVEIEGLKVHKKTLKLNQDPLPTYTSPKTSTLPVKSTYTPTKTSSGSGKQSYTGSNSTTTSLSNRREVRITNWFPRITHTGKVYVVTGSDFHGTPHDVLVKKEVYDMLADPNSNAPEYIVAKFVGSKVSQGKYIAMLDGTQEFELIFDKEKDITPKKEVQTLSKSKVYKGFNNKPMSLRQIKKLLKLGCCNDACGNTAGRKDAEGGQITWLFHDEYLCKSCSQDYNESKLRVTRHNGITEIQPVH